MFLYPENYTEPDLRLDKTHIFKELEDELLQQKITQDSATAAYTKYVAELAKLARLRIAGSYYHDGNPDDPTIKPRYYFFGRTNEQPYEYFYRTLTPGHLGWGNWVKIDLGIEATEISAIVYLGKLYIFWTQVKRKEINNITRGTSSPGGYVFTVYVKYSYLDEHGKWAAPQRVEIGQMQLADIQSADDMIYKRVWGPLVQPTDTNREMTLDQFQVEVFRKPYPIRINDDQAPIRLYYIWSQKVNSGLRAYQTEPISREVRVPAKKQPTQFRQWPERAACPTWRLDA